MAAYSEKKRPKSDKKNTINKVTACHKLFLPFIGKKKQKQTNKQTKMQTNNPNSYRK